MAVRCKKMKSTAEYKDGAGKGRIPFSIGQRFNQCFPIQTTTVKKSYAVIGIIPPLLLNAGAENIPLPCLLMAPDLFTIKKTAEAVFSLAWETRGSMVYGRTAFTPGEYEFLIPSH